MKSCKLLFVVRHAKSSWKDLSLDDHDRPLNKRGERDALLMGKRISSWIKPDILISSTAFRALRTAEIISSQTGYKRDDIDLNKKIYFSGKNRLLKIVQNIDNKHNSAMIFGHNPEFTNFVNFLTGDDIANIPTCGVAVILIETDTWRLASQKNSSLISYDFPKRLR